MMTRTLGMVLRLLAVFAGSIFYLGHGLAVEITVDNAALGVQDAAGGRTFTGKWCTSIAANKFGANSFYSCGSGLDTYRWTPRIVAAGLYDTYVWWPSNVNRSTAVPITVAHANGSTAKNFNERVGGGQWLLHGRYRFNAGTVGYIQVTDANGQAGADAVRLVTADSTPPVPSAGSPAILFTDVEVGPVSGGPGNRGVPIAIFGKGFGATRGTSRVTIGDVEVASYLAWGQNNANNTALDMIVVQPGPIAAAGAITVTVAGKVSNSNHRFSPTVGKVYYVAPAGSDSAACTEAQPCATILNAVTNRMQPGDALLVRGGDLNDDEIWVRGDLGHSGTLTAPKIVRNYPAEAPTFNVATRPVIIDADYITFSGFHFRNGKSLGVGYETSRGNRIINNTFRGTIGFDALGTHGNDLTIAGNECSVTASSVGTQGHCYYISNGSNIRLLYNVGRGSPGYNIHIFDQRRRANDIRRVIANVLVEGNLLASSPQRSGLIVAMGDEDGIGNLIDGVTIRNNIFVANNFAGVAIGGNVRNVKVYHNTFYQNGRQGLMIYDEPSINGIEVINNLFDQTVNSNCRSNCSWYADAHVQKGVRALGVTLSNNFYAPGPPLLIGTADSAAATGSPGFANAPLGDFRLSASSLAVDKGLLLPSVSVDFNGQPRVLGARPDAGAFERP